MKAENNNPKKADRRRGAIGVVAAVNRLCGPSRCGRLEGVSDPRAVGVASLSLPHTLLTNLNHLMNNLG